MSDKGSIDFKLNRAWCKACGLCAGLCPRQALDLDGEGKPLLARPEQCTVCGLCELRCPDYALRIRREEK